MIFLPPLGTKQPEPPEPEPEQEDTEAAAVFEHRKAEAMEAGLNDVEAEMFAASNTDIGLLRKLVRGGCDIESLRKIIL